MTCVVRWGGGWKAQCQDGASGNCMLLGPGLGYLDERRLNKDLYTYIC